MTAVEDVATGPIRIVRGRRGAVVSPQHLATAAGLSILRAGGSAVDAAIATNAALAVVAGYSCGLGGDAFWIIWDAEAGEPVTLNGSGRSGARATVEGLRAAGHVQPPERGAWSITVPGAVDSWGRAHARFGRLEWTELLRPAIELAEGFPAESTFIEAVEKAGASFGPDGDWARVYRSAGRPWRAGEVVRLTALAETLRRLADAGPQTAYRGALAERTTAYLARHGVPIDASDLAAHTSDWDEPIGVDYRGARSLSHPPNSVGVVALQTLRILERFDAPLPSAFGGRGWSDPGWIHFGLEASRLALAERDAWVTDAAHMAPDAVAGMLSDERVAALAARIDPDRARPTPAGSLPAGGGTAYLAAADRWGGLVSLLQSNYRGFGSGLVDPQTGIAFHDRGAFFRSDPGHPNILAPRKRPTHTLAPGLLLRDGRPWIAHGSMGGEIQPQIFAQFVSAVVDGGADIAAAVGAPRWAARMREQHGAADVSELESRFDPAIAADLRARGHAVSVREPWAADLGHAHAIELVEVDGEVTFAAAVDPRSPGAAAAF